VHQVVPRLKPGGRKKLCDGLEAQNAILLFRWFTGFTDKRKLLFIFKEIFYSFSSYKIAEGIFFYLAGRRQPGKNTSLRQNNWGFPAARPVVFTESVSPDSVKENQLSVLSASAVKIIQTKTLLGSISSHPFYGW